MVIIFQAFVLASSLQIAMSKPCAAFNDVSTFIGTGGPAYGYGGVNPGAQYPFSPLRLGPDTNNNFVSDISFRHFSGYNYLDNYIRAFSHTHSVGAGVNDLGNIGIMPYRMKPDKSEVEIKNRTRFWWSSFDKSTESSSPGRYSVLLNDPKVHVDLLAIGTHAGVHRYTWDSLDGGSIPGIVIDLCHAAKLSEDDKVQDSPCLEATLTVDKESQTFSGSVHFAGSLSHNIWVHVYGEIVPSSSKISVESWRMCSSLNPIESCSSDVDSLTGTDGVLFTLASFRPNIGEDEKLFTQLPNFQVDIRIGLSFISTDLAKQNLRAALKDTQDFLALAERTKSEWCETLSFASITPLNGDNDMSTIFYSAAYRSFMSPTRYTETGGLYLDLKNAVRNATAERIALYGDATATAPLAYAHYSDLSFWDTFRSQHPLLLLLNEDLAVGIIRSVTDMTALQGSFPRWVMANHEASCMVGNHGSAIVLEAIESGLAKHFDASTIQKALLRQSTEQVPINGRTDVEHYLAEGFVSMEASDRAAVLTLTNAFDDFVLAGISKSVGDLDSAKAALLRSQNYRNVWSHKRQFVCPKSVSGDLVCPRSPVGVEAWNEFIEGDAWHYTYFVPHDPRGLVSLFPTPQAFDDSLAAFFDNHVKFHEKLGSAAPNPYFWAGNEHDSLAPWLFNYGPNCTRTQYWTRRVTHMHYSATAHGIPGNEDYGAMSSWVFFASIGLFPQSGSTRFLVGSPRLQKASLTLRQFGGTNSVLDIETYNNSEENVFVEKLLVNGVELTEPFIERSVLVAGAKLEFFMQSAPSSGLCA